MAGTRDLKTRIKGIRNVQQITKAMKMVAAARIKKAEAKVKASRPYTEKMGEMVRNITGSLELTHPLFTKRDVQKVGLMIISADKGLCGSYNHNIIKTATGFIESLKEKSFELIIIGKKAHNFFRKRDYKIDDYFQISNYPAFSEALAISEKINHYYLSGYFDEIQCIYTRFISAMTQRTQTKRILPLVREEIKGVKDFIFEPSQSSVLEKLLPQYVAVLIYNILLESKASEMGARLVAMGNATDNAQKLIDGLTLMFYRARQEQITKEIIEVSSGAEALK